MTESSRPWYYELNRYHWFVLIVATLGWMFDCLDQQLFNLARVPAVRELLQVGPTDPSVGKYAGYATSILLIGWGAGGIVFGILGDKIGRAKTMVWTILFYSVFTGLSGFSYSFWDFALYRFLTGFGVGGQFAVGVSLVAEVMPDRARPFALGMLQAMSALGNVTAALIGMAFGYLKVLGVVDSSWRWMFAVGIVPSLLAVLVFRKLKEPERWKAAVAAGGLKHKAGSVEELFGDPRWRKRTIVGMLLASAGVIGLWGIGFFSIDLNRSVLRKVYEQEARQAAEADRDRQFVRLALASSQVLDEVKSVQPASLLSLDATNKDPQVLYSAALDLRAKNELVSPAAVLAALNQNGKDRNGKDRPAQSAEERQRRGEYLNGGSPSAASLGSLAAGITARTKEIDGNLDWWAGITSMMFNIGAFFGVYAFSRVTHKLGRRPTFAIAFVLAMASTIVAFLFMNSRSDVFWMVPLMGFCQLSLFGGYAIYFPELFPTRLRSTGTSFCYNIARFVSAAGPSALGLLTSEVFVQTAEPMRYAGVTMCGIFVLGLVVLPFAPETRGQPLPE
ncbi:MAG: MFS transporter [Pirellulales bacterium]